jgi:hypothetical protein
MKNRNNNKKNKNKKKDKKASTAERCTDSVCDTTKTTRALKVP